MRRTEEIRVLFGAIGTRNERGNPQSDSFELGTLRHAQKLQICVL